MFAVLKTGGKQYRVAEGDVLRVERLAAEAGETIQFNDVLMLGGDTVIVGAPTIAGAAVTADVIDQIKGEKLIHFVKRRRKHSSQRTKGHRQKLTLLRVTSILASGGETSGIKAAIGSGSMTAEEKAAAKPASNKPVRGKPSTAAKVADGAGAEKAATRKKAAPKKTAPKMATEAAASSTGTTGDKPSNLLSEARGGKADDLKKISGVGPKLESLLHENGVFHFDQILAWGEDEVAYMNEQLSFKGRIERDGWIDQAKQFAAEQE